MADFPASLSHSRQQVDRTEVMADDRRDSGWIRFEDEARGLAAAARRLGDDWQIRTFEASVRSFEF